MQYNLDVIFVTVSFSKKWFIVFVIGTPQGYATWGAPPQTQAVAQSVYQTAYAQLSAPVPAQAPPQWGQPPPAIPAAVGPHQPSHGWPTASPATVAYASPPPVSAQPQYQGTVYVPPSTPQPHTMWAGAPHGPTPPPQAGNTLPTLSGKINLIEYPNNSSSFIYWGSLVKYFHMKCCEIVWEAF